MRYLMLSACLLAGAHTAGAQAPTTLEKGVSVRVWSSRFHLSGGNGWVQDKVGTVLSIKVPAEAHLETDELFRTVALDTRDVDSLEAQIGGRWWRANFAGEPFTPVDVRVRSPYAIENVPAYSRVRVWSPARRLRDARGVLVFQQPDSVEIHLGSPGSQSPTLAIATSDIQRMQVPVRGWSTRRSMGYGIGLGLLSGVVYTLARPGCVQTPGDTTAAPGGGSVAHVQCNIIPPQTFQNAVIGAAAGGLAGWATAWYSRRRWHDVELPKP